MKRWLTRILRWAARHLRPARIDYMNGAESLPSPLSPDEESDAMRRLTEGDLSVRTALIEHNLRLVVYIARKFENTGVPTEDLVSIGAIGLIKAVNTFDPTKKIKLATYASRCIENEILMHLRRTSRLKAEVFPSYADNKRVDWESDDVSIATVEKGTVTAVAEGETIIRVTTHDGDFTDECRIRVASIATGVEEVADRPNVYPTAVETTLFVELKQPETVYLVSMTGQLYLAKDMQPGINRIDMSNCPTGVYLVRTKDETVKVVKK